jgi:hemerythrin-like metal-binding protein
MPILITTNGFVDRRKKIRRFPITNIKEIDDQHQEILDKLNELIDLVDGDMDQDKIILKLNEFSELLIIHFGTEEKYMIMSNFPDRAEHFESHKDFLLTFILDRKRFFSEEKPVDLNALAREVAGHINAMDNKMALYLKKHHW